MTQQQNIPSQRAEKYYCHKTKKIGMYGKEDMLVTKRRARTYFGENFSLFYAPKIVN